MSTIPKLMTRIAIMEITARGIQPMFKNVRNKILSGKVILPTYVQTISGTNYMKISEMSNLRSK